MSETDSLLKNKKRSGNASTLYGKLRLAMVDKNARNAALLIRDAMTDIGRVDAFWTNVSDGDTDGNFLVKLSIFCKWVLAQELVSKCIRAFALILVALSFFEDPGWCREWEGGCERVLSLHGVPAFGKEGEVDVEYYPSWRTNFLRENHSFVVECICALALAIYTFLLLGRSRMDVTAFVKKHAGGVTFFRLVLVFSVFVLLAGLIATACFDYKRPERAYIRLIIFITFNTTIQRELILLKRVIPDVANVYVFLGLIIVFYAWVGNAMFYESHEGHAHFSTLIEAMFTLWICVTTSNYPDVMMYAYNEHRLASLYFISFMVIAFYFIMNVILSSVVNSYTTADNEFDDNHVNTLNKNMNDAYALLDPDGKGCVDKKTVMQVFLVLNLECPEIRHISDTEAELLFAMLDRDGSEKISSGEFIYFSQLMMIEFKRYIPEPSLIESHFSTIYNSAGYKQFSGFILSETFDVTVNILIFLNAILVFVQSFPELSGQDVRQNPHIQDGELDTPWEYAETVFTILYTIEMICKVLVMGWRNYKMDMRNVFDGFITILAIASTIYVYYPNRYSNSLLVRYIVMARVLRLGRLLMAIPQFQLPGRIFIKMVPHAYRVFLLLGMFMYIFSAIGMQVFGGLITRDPDNPVSYTLKGTAFAENMYWANSHNDLLSGMNVLFNLLVVNNWPNQADGILAVSGTRFSRYFFVLFHIIGVTIVNNVVVGFVMDMFMDEFENSDKNKKTGHTTGDLFLDDDKAIFDAREITGTKTKVRGRFVATVKAIGRKKEENKKILQYFFNPHDEEPDVESNEVVGREASTRLMDKDVNPMKRLVKNKSIIIDKVCDEK